ncbi:MAG: 50S ribosomal protein L3 [Candidatus Omnitrophica bacterium]|nr:50S ribosomal protein L3 [Candidatus Omnitrophota bacterium]
MQALLGTKIGMTQFIRPDGRLVPATALQAGPCLVTDLRTPEKHGYKAVQMGYGELKPKKACKAYRIGMEKKKLPLKKWLREIRLSPSENYEIGQTVQADIFKAGDLVDVQGTSIGKGFAGGVKRWHWRGGPKTHGSMFHRRIGSAGASSFPSRTWPGQRMPGHLGDAKATLQNLEVLRVDAGRHLLLVKGSVPGGDNSLVFIRKSLKKPEGIKVKVEQKKAEKKKDVGKKKEEKPKK